MDSNHMSQSCDIDVLGGPSVALPIVLLTILSLAGQREVEQREATS